MRQDEWQSFWDSVTGIVPMCASYMLGIIVVSLSKYFERHKGKEAFSWVKLIIGLFRDVVWGLTLMCGALWLSHGNHYCTAFVVSLGVLRGYKWSSDTIDTILYDHFKVERRK